MTEEKERDAYLGKLEAHIQEWVLGIDNLAARADHVEPHLRVEFRQQVNELRARGAAARARLEELREVPPADWEDVRILAEQAGAELQAAVEETLERYP